MSFVITYGTRARVVFALCLLLLCPAPRASAQTAALPSEKILEDLALRTSDVLVK